MTYQKSFEDVKSIWLPEVKKNADQDLEKVLLLNKMDLPQKDLDAREVQSFCSAEGIMVYETSAKTGKNVNGVFLELCRKLISRNNDTNRKRSRNMTTDKSLFQSSHYEGDIKLNAANAGNKAQNSEEAKGCCGG